MMDSGAEDQKEQLEWTWKLHTEPANVKLRKGAAVSHGDTAYFHPRDSQKVLQYKNKWSALQECPQQNFGLAIVDDLLTAVGGKVDGVAANRLMSFTENEWKEQLPAMSTKREMPAVIRVNNYPHSSRRNRRGRRPPILSGGDEYRYS